MVSPENIEIGWSFSQLATLGSLILLNFQKFLPKPLFCEVALLNVIYFRMSGTTFRLFLK